MPSRLITEDDLRTAGFDEVAGDWADSEFVVRGAGVTCAATEGLEAGDFVNIYDNGGVTQVRLAIASDATLIANGFVLNDVIGGAQATVYLSGMNTAAAVTTTASEVYLSDAVAGKPSLDKPTTPGYVIQPLGVAIANVGIFFTPQTKIVVS